MAGPVGGRRAVSDPGAVRPAQVLFPDDVPVSQRGSAHRTLVHDDGVGRQGPVPQDAGTQRVLPHRLRRLRAAGRERRDPARHPPISVDDGQHRADAGAAALDGGDVRLVAGGRHLPPRVLHVEPVVLPEVPRSRPGLPGDGRRGLVPPRQHDPGAGAGHRARPGVRAVRHAGDQEGPGAVVLPHHAIHGGTAGLQQDGVAGTRADAPAQLDRPQRGRGGRLHQRAGRPDHRLHHAAGHALRRDVSRPGPGAPAGGQAHDPGPPRRGGGLRPWGAPAVGDRTAGRGPGEDGRLHRRLRPPSADERPDSHLHRGLCPPDLRHRRDPRRAGARRPGLRVRPRLRPAHPRGDRPSRLGRQAPPRGVCRGRPDGQLGALRRDAEPGGAEARHRGARARRSGPGGGDLPPAGLVDQPPAVLGDADPDHLLPAVRNRPRAVCGPAGGAAGGRRVRPHRGIAAQAGRALPAHPLPALRRGRGARDGHDGHLRRFIVVPVPLSEPARPGAAVRSGGRTDMASGGSVHRRHRARGAAPAVHAVLHQSDARPRVGRLR